MAKRKSLTKKIRFEVFKRDSFTCQYCGRMAPDVVLEIDHIKPVKEGGDNNILNLITSCFDCNRGKGKRNLNKNDELKKQQEELKKINIKREQLKMMVEWREELELFEEEQARKIEYIFKKETGHKFLENGIVKIKKLIKKFGFDEVYLSTKISLEQYYDFTDKTPEIVFDYIPKICQTRKSQKENPMLYNINYLVKIAENKFYYCNKIKLKKYLLKYMEQDDFDYLKMIFTNVRNWTELKEELEEYFGYEC